MIKRVAIIGGGAKESDFFKAHADLPELHGLAIWGLNAIRYPWVPRWDKMFNLHTYENLMRYGWPVDREVEFTHHNPSVPFYTMDKKNWPAPHELGSSWRTFPREPFINARNQYHCSSFDWLIAHAMRSHVNELTLHSVNWALANDEPLAGRACMEYWCGYAEANGMVIKQDPRCDNFCFVHIVKSDLIYGLDDTPVFEDRRAGARDGAPYRYDD